MSQKESSEALPPALRAATAVNILHGGLLPARYLNSFNSQPQGMRVNFINRYGLEVCGATLELNDMQSFALNALAVCVNSTITIRRLSEASRMCLSNISDQRFSLAVHHLARRINTVMPKPIFDIKRGKRNSCRLHSVYFSQESPPDNELFNLLHPALRRRFGQQVLTLGLGEELMRYWKPPHQRPVPKDPSQWRHYAKCRDSPDLFVSGNFDHQEEAKRICELCTVRNHCLEEAMVNREPVGVWGGLSMRERQSLKATNFNGS